MKKINTPLIDHTFEGVVKQQWYRDYVEVDDLLLSEMLAAANFMDIGEYSLFVAWGQTCNPNPNERILPILTSTLARPHGSCAIISTT